MRVEILVDDILEPRLFDGLQHRFDRWVARKIISARRVERLRELHAEPRAFERVVRHEGGAREDQLAKRLDRRPTGKGVVADVRETAGFELRRNEIEHRLSLARPDPTEHAVRGDVIERGERVAIERLEVVLDEANVLDAATARGRLRGGDVLGVEIDADEAR